MSDLELRFKIEAYSPKTIPMERLGQYMADLGAMLGDPAAVHFVKLLSGSTNIVHKIEEQAAPAVLERVDDIRRGEGDVINLNAYRALNRKLKEDNGSGKLMLVGSNAPLLRFAGVKAPEPAFVAPVVQPGSIDGTLISLGGRDATVPVRIQEGDTVYRCGTSRDVARQLGPHLFGGTLRLVGEGRWFRSEEGIWTLDQFKILSFEPLDERPLPEIVAQLRRVRNEYGKTGAWDELLDIRDEGNDLN